MTINQRRIAQALARRVGATLDYNRKRWHGGGVQTVDTLHHESELDEDIWPGVIADLKILLP